ncbi:MAG: DUF3592 domain-containing protein [Limisphaerales bacterium]
MPITFFKHKLLLLVLAMVIALMGFRTQKFFREARSRHWPRTTAVIARCYLERAHQAKGSFGFVPNVVYLYTIGGQCFAGARIDFDTQDHIYSRAYAESWLRNYPRGKITYVYYDPGTPQFAVLEPGIKGRQKWLLALGLGYIMLLVIVFLCVLYDYLRGRANSRRNSQPGEGR